MLTKPAPPDLKTLLDTQPMSSFQILMVAICFILNMNDGIDVLVVSFTGSEIVREWSLSKSELGYIFSAGLAGMTAGCFLLAPFGDKIGRRTMFIIALSLITTGMLLSSLVGAYYQLLLCRLITGLGIGGILPSLAAVAAEFSNNKRRDFSVGFVQAGWPIGAILAGFFTAWAIPLFGWRSAYLAAGLVSALMLLSIVLFMPESLAFLIGRQPKNALRQVNQLLTRMGQASISVLPPTATSHAAVPISDLFTPEYRASTIRLWIGIFFGMMTLYTVMSWVPTLAKDAGMPFELATYIGTALNLGAFSGSLSFGLLAGRIGLRKLILLFMVIAFGSMVLYGNLSMTYWLMFMMTFFIGFFVQGGFNGFYPTTARVYPARMRTTGVGLSMGIGRFGAILGPTLFGMLSDAELSKSLLFVLFSAPLLVAGVMAFTIPSKNLD
ncbi:MFS transporter [Spirosoma sp. KCTC 42546]|uniref:MFS transporter n=1 Tax=Spirosoma sp. KCTC 42546 TaxID=2520506 RepID=UPI00115ACABC|nr:MFS transporter [Spirosoma sp. KCTC 42546]QDK81934.1 MFS transporter [Spirosoma sp. KCTC 42546]